MKINEFKFAHVNIRSLVKSIEDLRDQLLLNKYDVLAIGETWLKDEISDRSIQVPGYTIVRNDRIHKRGGGLAFYLIDSLDVKVIPTSDAIEQLWIKVKLNQKQYVFGVVYRPHDVSFNTFLNEVDHTFASVIGDCDELICTGDFNVDMSELEDMKTIQLRSLIESYNLKQIIDEPTRITDTTATLLDLIIMSDSLVVCDGGASDFNLTDHQLVYCTLELKKDIKKCQLKTYRSFKYFDLDNFTIELMSLPFYEMFDMNDVNVKIEFLTRLLNKLFDKHAPVTVSRFTKPYAPWLTDNIRLMMTLRDDALKKFKKSRKMSHWDYYKQLRNYTTQAVRNEKKAFFEHELQNLDSKSLWKKLDKYNIHSKSKTEIPLALKDPNKFNDFFINTIPKITSVNNETVNSYNNSKLVNENCIFNFIEVDQKTILKIVNSIKSTAIGADGLNINMIKLCLPHILPYLSHIINACLIRGIFPESWKLALITPLPKISNPVEFKHFRPVSILPVLSKVLEKVIDIQIRNYLEKHTILPDTQSGFRPGYSCNSALLNICDDILKKTDDNKLTLLVLLDYSKAFDTLNHEILIAMLGSIGFGEIPLKLFKTYLNDRKQAVRISSVISNMQALHSGVPQGSILGPLLFTIYTSTFNKTLKFCNSHQYADDTQIYYSFSADDAAIACFRINEDMKRIVEISQNHSLIINSSKTNSILFGPNKIRNAILPYINILVNNEQISLTNVIKNLGLTIDCQLRFSEQVVQILKKSYGNLKILYPYRHILSTKIKILLCDALVLSHLNYCDVIYGPCLSVVDKNRLQQVQRACLRYIYGVRKYDSISHKLVDTGWLSTYNRRLLHTASMFHKIIINKSPKYLYDKIKFRFNIHSINVRPINFITIPKHNSEKFKSSFSYQIANVINKLKPQCRSMSNLCFKRYYRNLLLTSQS